MMTFADLDGAVRQLMRDKSGTIFGYENALRDYLASEHITDVSDEALARVAALYGASRNGHAEEAVGLVAAERERRSQVRHARNELTAAKALWWSRAGAWAAVAAAVAAIVVLFK